MIFLFFWQSSCDNFKARATGKNQFSICLSKWLWLVLQISNMVFQLFFMFLWSKEHFREKFCKEISTMILNSTLFTTSWLDVYNLLLIRGGAGVGFKNWAEWAWLRAGRRAGIHWYAGKVKSLARKIYTSFAVIVRRLPHTTSDIWLWGQAP